MSVNRVLLQGHVGGDAEITTLESGAKVAKFSIATTEFFKDKDGNKKETTEWHRVSVWGKQAENAGQFIKKGRNVFIEGKLKSSEWNDKTTGEKKKAWEINAENFQLLDKNPNATPGTNGSSAAPAMANTNAGGNSNANDNDDLPF